MVLTKILNIKNLERKLNILLFIIVITLYYVITYTNLKQNIYLIRIIYSPLLGFVFA
jgi:hypothetical protein